MLYRNILTLLTLHLWVACQPSDKSDAENAKIGETEKAEKAEKAETEKAEIWKAETIEPAQL